MRKKAEEPSSEYSWMDTYGDMVTLLLTFFVLLFSMSSMDQSKWKRFVEAFNPKDFSQSQSHNSGENPNDIDLEHLSQNDNNSDMVDNSNTEGQNAEAGQPEIKNVDQIKEFDDLYLYLNNYIKENNLEGEVNLFKGDGYTFVTFNNNIFFDGDSSVLRDESKQLLDILAEALRSISGKVGEIRAYGHTARSGSATSPNNPVEDRTLSVLRANNVILYLQLKNILSPAKMVAEGYGENRPIIPHDGTEATREKNRRVELYISKEGKANTTLEDIYKEINKPTTKEEKP